ncbi:MAG TPA: alkaline phosphatase family protein [Candidatus Acidoferrales bacterium]|nr:alkaline phosphatase family protein [Candidatus Acidoferrales bacterium]
MWFLRATASLALLASLVACGRAGNALGETALPAEPAGAGARETAPASPIRHVVIVVQENRSFDNLFATFPKADGARQGRMSDGSVVPLVKQPLALPRIDPSHEHRAFVTEYDGGKMDGFDKVPLGAAHPGLAGRFLYQYVDPKDILPYRTLAERYVLADRMFATESTGSFVAHQDLIAGGAPVGRDSLVDTPLGGRPWGCDAPPGTVTSLIDRHGDVLWGRGPFPCMQYRTLRDLLDAAHVSWRYYVPPPLDNGNLFWNAFDVISAVRYGPQWQTNVVSPSTRVLADAANGTLPAVSWVIPDGRNSDHPGSGSSTGPSWVAAVVNAIGTSRYWNSTAIVIVWDDWGGFYDHVPPPQKYYFGLGFRVPAIVVSPYVRRDVISHTQYEFGSILRFIEDNWNLGSLGRTDARATSIGDVFDFTIRPRKFHRIPAPYSTEFFERQKPSNVPVDTE